MTVTARITNAVPDGANIAVDYIAFIDSNTSFGDTIEIPTAGIGGLAAAIKDRVVSLANGFGGSISAADVIVFGGVS